MENDDIQENLRQAIKSATSLRFVDNDYLFFDKGWSVYFREQHLAEYHPQLPSLVKYLCEDGHPRMMATLRSTLEYWTSPVYECPHGAGVFYSKPSHIAKDAPLDDYPITCNTYHVREVAPGLQVVYRESRDELNYVSKTWLDKYFPGLTDKLSMLEAMGCNENEASRLALADFDNFKHSNDLLGVSFD